MKTNKKHIFSTGRGAEHYNERNWEKAKTKEEYDKFKESAFRHFIQWFYGETDEDHAASIFFNVQGAEYVKFKLKQPEEVLLLTDQRGV